MKATTIALGLGAAALGAALLFQRPKPVAPAEYPPYFHSPYTGTDPKTTLPVSEVPPLSALSQPSTTITVLPSGYGPIAAAITPCGLNYGTGPWRLLPQPDLAGPCWNFTPMDPVAGQEILFDGSCSYIPPGAMPQYSWMFDDEWAYGGTVRVRYTGGPRITHAYKEPGSYQVNLGIYGAGLRASQSTSGWVNVC